MANDGNRQHRGVRRLHLIEQRLDVARGGHAEREARERSGEHHREDFHGHVPRNIAGWRAKRHANADFVPPLEHGVVEHAVEADTRKQSATIPKKSASLASSRSRTVCDWLISVWVRMLLTRNSGRARATSRRRSGRHSHADSRRTCAR